MNPETEKNGKNERTSRRGFLSGVLQHDAAENKKYTDKVEQTKGLMEHDNADQGRHHRLRAGQNGHFSALTAAERVGEEQVRKESGDQSGQDADQEIVTAGPALPRIAAPAAAKRHR